MPLVLSWLKPLLLKQQDLSDAAKQASWGRGCKCERGLNAGWKLLQYKWYNSGQDECLTEDLDVTGFIQELLNQVLSAYGLHKVKL